MGAVTNPTVRYVFIDMSRMFVYQQYAKHCIIYCGKKYRDDDFIEHVICDINTLLETWKGDSSDIKIPNYYSLSKCRARKKRARRNSGGIIVYIKTELKRDIECIENISKSHNRICLGRDRMAVGFTTTCAISTYHH
jgi:hypothetical protein